MAEYVREETQVAPPRTVDETGPARQAYGILHAAFVIVPTVAGLDKFTHFLVNWDQFLAPYVAQRSPITGHNLMLLVGGVEILAGVIVALKPKVGGYLVMLWLWAIIANLILARGFYDIALRDFGLSLGALALGRLAAVYDRKHVRDRTGRVVRERDTLVEGEPAGAGVRRSAHVHVHR